MVIEQGELVQNRFGLCTLHSSRCNHPPVLTNVRRPRFSARRAAGATATANAMSAARTNQSTCGGAFQRQMLSAMQNYSTKSLAIACLVVGPPEQAAHAAVHRHVEEEL
eukprot:SAG11_NODE_5258_length_1613_cov_2.725892_1_plen_109_part_00